MKKQAINTISNQFRLKNVAVLLLISIVGLSFISPSSVTGNTQELETNGDDAMVAKVVIVAGTGTNYAQMRSQMMTLSKKAEMEVDTIGRGLNAETGRIALPNDSDDELYAGQYFPRRYDSESLSLEYLSVYDKNVAPETIGLITGIYTDKGTALVALHHLQTFDTNAYILETKLYMGCMH